MKVFFKNKFDFLIFCIFGASKSQVGNTIRVASAHGRGLGCFDSVGNASNGQLLISTILSLGSSINIEHQHPLRICQLQPSEVQALLLRPSTVKDIATT